MAKGQDRCCELFRRPQVKV